MSYRFTVLDGPARLGEHLAAWEDLAACAAEPNVFYEPWMLLPAVEAFGQGSALRFVLAYSEQPGRPRELCALFPLELRSRYHGLPFTYLRLWKHKHCYLATPLVRQTQVRECLAAFLDWIAADPRGASFIEWGLVSGDGMFYECLRGVLHDTRRRSFESKRFTRAVLRPRQNAVAFLAETLSSKSRKEFRRLERRLSDLGTVQYTEAHGVDESQRLIQDFLELEARGWKGHRGSALSCDEADRRFFTRIVGEAVRRGRCMMLGLAIAGRPVALKCNFLAGDGSFAFKIAYDEAFARYSPGVLLELENIRRFHLRPGLRWMDSCAEAEHFMANRLWVDRRILVTIVTASGVAGNFCVAALPLFRRLYRSLRGALPATATS